MKISQEDTLQLIPQKAPFVMIDHLIFSDDKSSRTQLQIREENIFVENGFLTEPGLIENIAQTAAAGTGYTCQQQNKPVPVGFIGAIKDVEILSMPTVNDVIETEVNIVNQIFDITIIKGTIHCNGKLLAQCEMKIFITQIQ